MSMRFGARSFRHLLYGGMAAYFLSGMGSAAQVQRRGTETESGLQQAERVDEGWDRSRTLIIRLSVTPAQKSAPRLPRHTHSRARLSVLNGLTVVLDPGHGGSTGLNPTGCSAIQHGRRVYEKELTLSIAQRLRRSLMEAGANVLMTRTEDVSVPLKARSALANDNDAALFVSIHIDDCAVPNAASGTTTYYHKQDPRGRRLAHCLVEAIGRVSGLPTRSARSDTSLYASGLAVLRNSAVPATLVEVGYMNNTVDRLKLVDHEFQERIARAMTEGLERYLTPTAD